MVTRIGARARVALPTDLRAALRVSPFIRVGVGEGVIDGPIMNNTSQNPN